MSDYQTKEFSANFSDTRIADDIKQFTDENGRKVLKYFGGLLDEPFKAEVAKRYIDELVKQNGNLDYLDATIHGTALMGAAAAGNIPIINHLLDNGAKIDITNPDGIGTALQNAAEGRHKEAKDATLLLLTRGANPNINLSPYRTVLGAIAKNGDKASYDLAIGKMDLSKIDHSVLLEKAVEGRNIDILKDLIEKRGIDVNAFSRSPGQIADIREYHSALSAAVREENVVAVDYLLSKGAVVDLQVAKYAGITLGNDVIDKKLDIHIKTKQGGELPLFHIEDVFARLAKAMRIEPSAPAAPTPAPAPAATTAAPTAPAPTPTPAAPATQHAPTADETAYIDAVSPILETLAGADIAAKIKKGLENVFSRTAGNDDITADDPLEAQLKGVGLMTPGEFFAAKKNAPLAK